MADMAGINHTEFYGRILPVSCYALKDLMSKC